eukprot:3472408-Pyramimonas_sp.AAC.1
MQPIHGLRAIRFQSETVALAPRTFVFNIGTRAERMDGGPFSECDSRLSTAHMRLRNCTRNSRMEASPFSKCESRFKAASILSKSSQY